MSSSRSGNESSSSAGEGASPVAAAPVSSVVAPARRVNRRFAAHLDHVQAQNARRQRRFWGIVALGTAGFGTAITIGWWNELPYLCLALLGAAAGFGGRAAFLYRGYRAQSRRDARLRALVQNGTVVDAYLIQACSALFRPQDEALPSLVLFTFQPEVAAEPEYLRHLARRVFSLKSTRQPDVDGRFVAGLTTEERGVPGRRRQLPLSFTDGSVIYCADLWVQPAHLKGGCLEGNVLHCIAEPGATGGVELVPWWLLSDPDRSSSVLEQEGAAGNRRG
jgi:hypothetical protein